LSNTAFASCGRTPGSAVKLTTSSGSSIPLMFSSTEARDDRPDHVDS
jgi:hypothetical protein